jgi:hypothetical protein
MAIAPAFVPPPTATQAVEVAQLIALRGVDGSGDTCALQVAPPLVVARMVPDRPTAKHVAEFGQLMLDRAFVVPDTWVDQVLPPSAERRMTPTSPTLKQVIAVGQLTPRRLLAVRDGPLIQLKPPSVVTSAVPASPTRTQWETSAQLAPHSELPCGSGFCQTHVPVPVAIDAAAVGPACPSSANAMLRLTAIKRFRDHR